MKHFKLLFLLAGLMFLYSCVTTNILKSKVNPAEVRDLQNFEPFSNISVITKGNTGNYNDTISLQAEQVLKNVTDKFRGQLHITGNVIINDTLLRNNLETEIDFLLHTAAKKRSINNLKLTPVLDSILEANNKRFGLIMISNGFTRTRANFKTQRAIGIAMAAATFGILCQFPIKNNSTVFVMIVDAKDNNVAFFRKTIGNNKDPLDEKAITVQLQKLFKGYFK